MSLEITDASRIEAGPLGSVAAKHLSRVSQALETIDAQQLDSALDLLLVAYSRRRRVYVMGNGGSAATAGHFACDLAKTVRNGTRDGLRVHALTDNVASVTAWANDTSYEMVFASQIATYVEAGDVVVAISASGNSPNILAGLREAAIRNANTLAIVGFDGGQASKLADVVLHVDDEDYGCVEDVHSALAHALTAALKQGLDPQSEAGS